MFRRPFVPAAVPSRSRPSWPCTAATVAAQTPAPAPAPRRARAAARDGARRSAGAAPQTTEERIEALDQQLRILARQLEIEKEAATATQATAPVAVAGPAASRSAPPTAPSAVRFRGYLHADSRYYADDDETRGVDNFLLRRARPDRRGDVLQDLRLPDHDGLRRRHRRGAGRLRRRALRARRFNLRVGKHEGAARPGAAAVGDRRCLFIERALPTALVPNRDVGIYAYGDLDAVADLSGSASSTASSTAAAPTSTPPTARTSSAACVVLAVQGRQNERLQSLTSRSAAARGNERGTRRGAGAGPASAAADSWCGSAIAPTARSPTPPSPTAGARGSRPPGSTISASSACRPSTCVVAPGRCAAPRPPTGIEQQAWQADRLVGADRRDGDRPGDRAAQAVRPGQGRLGRVRDRGARQRADRSTTTRSRCSPTSTAPRGRRQPAASASTGISIAT